MTENKSMYIGIAREMTQGTVIAAASFAKWLDGSRSLPEPEGESDLLTVTEVAAILRCDVSSVRRWIRQGILDAITLPHKGHYQVYRIRELLYTEYFPWHRSHFNKMCFLLEQRLDASDYTWHKRVWDRF